MQRQWSTATHKFGRLVECENPVWTGLFAERGHTIGAGDAGYGTVVGSIGRRRHRVVQQVGSQHIPRLVDIVGDENRCGSARNGKLDDSGLVSVSTALRFVELLQTR